MTLLLMLEHHIQWYTSQTCMLSVCLIIWYVGLMSSVTIPTLLVCCVQVRGRLYRACLRSLSLTGTLSSHSQCTVSEHVCLCCVCVKHYKDNLTVVCWVLCSDYRVCSIVPPFVSFAACGRYAVLFRKYVSRQGAGKGKVIPHRKLSCVIKATLVMRRKQFKMVCSSCVRLVVIAHGRSSLMQ